MSAIWRGGKVENTQFFLLIEWSFDDDISIASELGTSFNDNECIQCQSPQAYVFDRVLQITLDFGARNLTQVPLHSCNGCPN
jgi:hypothetical protein